MVDFGILEINQDWKSYENVTDSFILKENYEMNFQKKFILSLQLIVLEIRYQLHILFGIEEKKETKEY